MKRQRAKKALENMGYSSPPSPGLNTISAEDLYYSAFYIVDPRLFRKRYMAVVGGWSLAGCFSIVMAGVLILETYLSGAPNDHTFRNWFFSGLVINAVFTIAQAQVLYGRIKCVWVNVGIYCLCFLASLFAITYKPNIYLYSMALLAPVIGLLILNSNRYRELRQTSVDIRHKREAIIATLKKQGRWKWW